jgi:hypothetical protein
MTMNRSHPYSGSRALLLALSSILLLVACQPKHEISAMTPEETQAIDTLTARLKPRCVGRYLIDLPIDFVLNPITTTKLEGVDITIVPMERGRFDAELTARKEAIAKERPVAGGKQPFLRAVHDIQDHSGVVFDRADAPDRAGIGRTLELHAWRAGFSLHLEIAATNYKDAGFDRPDDPPNDVPEKLAHLLNVYERVRGRNDLEIPAEQGVCFANGFLRGEPNDDEKSQIDLYYHLRTAKDVYLSFYHLSGTGSEDDTLLERAPAIEKHLKAHNGQTLRKGKRDSHGLKFEEWLSSRESETSPGMMFHDMTMEMNSKSVTALTPLFIIDLDSGVRYPRPPSSLEEAAVRKPLTKATFSATQTVALWDKVTATLRPRPVTAQAAPAAEPVSVTSSAPQVAAPRLPLGTALASGTRCPQSGTWQCATANAVGGARRSFTAGETLSSVLVPVERSFLQRIKGTPQNELAATVWTLIAYTDSEQPV